MTNHCFLQPYIYMMNSVWHLDLVGKGQGHENCTEKVVKCRRGLERQVKLSERTVDEF